jgi:hypothetical protein
MEKTLFNVHNIFEQLQVVFITYDESRLDLCRNLNCEALLGMQVIKSNPSAQVALENSRRNDLFHLKLQWISAKDESVKMELSETIRKHLASAH